MKLKHFLFEQPEINDASSALINPQIQATTEPQNISVDQKIDAFMMEYEKEAQPNYVQESKTNKFFKLIFEADEDMPEDEAPPTDDAPPDMPADDSGPAPDSAPTDSDKPAEATPKINLEVFATRMARLINNYEVLINPKPIILNRAQTYLAKNYNDKVAKEFLIMMEQSFGLTAKTLEQQQDDLPRAPFAAGAGPSISGAGGGSE